MDKYQWIKLDVDIFNNRKVKKIESEEDGQLMVLIWIKLLVLSAQIKDNGQVYITKNVGYSPKELANELGYFGKKLEKIIEKSLKLFEMLEMIENDNGIITINNWHRYQDYEKEEKTRKLNAERQREYRASKINSSKQYGTNNCDITSMTHKHNALDKEVDVDVDVEEEVEENKITHFVRREEDVMSDRVSDKPQTDTTSPNNNRYQELTELYPRGILLGFEKKIDALSEEDYIEFKQQLAASSNPSYFVIKRILLAIATGHQVV